LLRSQVLDGRTQKTLVGNPAVWGAADWIQTNKMVGRLG
jgi:hypothetical protein